MNAQRRIVGRLSLHGLLVAGCLLANPVPHPLHARTERSGVLVKNERWTADQSPYVITNDLMIAPDVRLVINPGTRILIDRPTRYIDGIEQIDHIDSFSTVIRVKGQLTCIGRPEEPVVFAGLRPDSTQCNWYGIVFDPEAARSSEIAYTTVTGACNGLLLRSMPLRVRNAVFEYNNIGLTCQRGADGLITNCVFTANHTSAIRIESANPTLHNNIIVFNHGNGIWCDGQSRITFTYNCIRNNGEADLFNCEPRIGLFTKTTRTGDSLDMYHNLLCDPVFEGSVAESLAVEMDITLPTDRSRLRDTTLAKVLTPVLGDDAARMRRQGSYRRFSLSKYSPCIDAGNPDKRFRDEDGSRNDMGIWGGMIAPDQP